MLMSAWNYFICELTLVLRQSSEWLYPLGFFLIVITLFPLAFNPDNQFLQQYIAGFVWIAALLSCLLSSQTIFISDCEEGFIDQLLLSTQPVSIFIAIKLLVLWIVNCLPLILLTPLIGLFFQLDIISTGLLALSLFLGTPVVLLIAAFSVALTLGLRQQGTIIGLMIFPLIIPILIFAVSILSRWQTGLDIKGPVALLSGLMLLAILLMPLAIAGALRLSVED